MSFHNPYGLQAGHVLTGESRFFVLGIIGVVWVLIFHVADTDYPTQEGLPTPGDVDKDLKEEERNV